MRRRLRMPSARTLFTSWAVLVYAVLYVPIALVVVFAFNANRYVTVWTGFTTHWFGDALNDPTYTSAITTSFKIAIINAVIATALGTAAALSLARMRRRWRAPFDVLVYLTLVVPEIVIAVASLIFFVQAHNHVSVFPTLGWQTILIAHVVFNASLVMLIVRARFVGMGSTLEEASFDLGAAPVSTFRQVTLPRLLPAVVASFLLAFTFSFDDYVLSVFNAGGSTVTWPMLVFAAVRFGVSPKINAFASIMIGLTLVVFIIAGIVLRRSRPGTVDDGAATSLGSAFGLSGGSATR